MAPFLQGKRPPPHPFETRRPPARLRERMRLNGIASESEDDPLMAEYPEAQFVTRVEATQVFPNCPRYIHEYRLVERSRFVPHEDCATPAPSWKTRDWARDVLPAGDPAL